MSQAIQPDLQPAFAALSAARSRLGDALQPGRPLSLQALLELDDMAFVEAAYATLLRRAPDEAGTAHVLSELAAGRSKIVLLGQLQNSAEGKRLGVRLQGLGRRYMAHWIYAIPFFGPVVRMGAGVGRWTGVSRALAGAEKAGGKQGSSDGPAPRAGTKAALLNQHQAALDLLTRRVASLQAVQEETARKTLAVAAEHAHKLDTLTRQTASFPRRLNAMEDSAIASLLALADGAADQAARLARLEETLAGEGVAAQIAAEAGALRQAIDERLGRVEALVGQNRRDVIDQQRRIGLMLETLRRRTNAPVSPAEFAALDEQDDHSLDSLYVAFEDQFRGTRADIKDRQCFYLPVLAESRAGTPDRAIVDVGCGRGEFLELMRDEGLTARGVDANESMVAACRDAGLDCVLDDAVGYLARQAPDSLGAVTGFHIIEHLPFKTMIRLFDEALRALAPGGVLVFETPNPANILTASRRFYLDPTHRNPLPHEMVAMVAEARGFTRISVVDLHPAMERFGGNDPVLRAELDRLFYGPQDYALLARKP